MEGKEPPLTLRRENQYLLGHFFPCTPGPFSCSTGLFCVSFPQSRSCTTGIWACTTGWRPALYLCTPAPCLGVKGGCVSCDLKYDLPSTILGGYLKKIDRERRFQPKVFLTEILWKPLRDMLVFGCSFFGYNWKLPPYSGAFSLSFSTYNCSFSTYKFSFSSYNFGLFAYSRSFFAYSGKVRLIRALRDSEQRSLTVSNKAPTVSKKASPLVFHGFEGPDRNLDLGCLRIRPKTFLFG